MKRIGILLVATLVIGWIAAGQPAAVNWNVLDNGGGRSVGGALTLSSSVGQSAAALMTDGVSQIAEGGYIPGIRILGGTLGTSAVNLGTGWNLVSIPVRMDDMRKSTLFPSAASFVFTYQTPGGYVRKDTLMAGPAYWVKYAGPTQYIYGGTMFWSDTLPVGPGWNMIGAPSADVPLTAVVPIAPVVITAHLFSYTPGGNYQIRDSLKPGWGYWLKVNQAGSLIIGGSFSAAASAGPVAGNRPSGTKTVSVAGGTVEVPDNFAVLTVTDKREHEGSLFYAPAAEGFNGELYSLPPAAPGTAFDVRFASQRFAEAPDAAHGTATVRPVSITGEFPVTVSWERGTDGAWLEVGTGKNARTPLSKAGNITINETDAAHVALVLDPRAATPLPKEFALHQNYPNPFNPSTKIRYDVPRTARVTIKLYNLLGQEVLTLVDGIQEPGFKSVTLNGSNLASGMYVYRMQSGQFTDTRKMMMMK